ncbi:hypothetical protein GCM10009117_04440 [Gangjinia marincola]|uniref:Uncharacterized protein n=1 Tax=Gangjinia marincola TaxID=578463 RepID=A0ABP3XSZ6_9FLAO
MLKTKIFWKLTLKFGLSFLALFVVISFIMDLMGWQSSLVDNIKAGNWALVVGVYTAMGFFYGMVMAFLRLRNNQKK